MSAVGLCTRRQRAGCAKQETCSLIKSGWRPKGAVQQCPSHQGAVELTGVDWHTLQAKPELRRVARTAVAGARGLAAEQELSWFFQRRRSGLHAEWSSLVISKAQAMVDADAVECHSL